MKYGVVNMSIVILLTYPLFSHLFVVVGHPQWAAVYLMVICGLLLIKELWNQNYVLAMIMAPLLIVGAVLVSQEQLAVLMYLPPIFISFGLFLLFGRSLLKSHIPLITRYARLIDGELNSEMLFYTKRVTQIWTALFLIMLIESIVLAIFFPVEIWSLFTNFLNYLVVIFVFFAEYTYRNKVYPELPKRNFLEFLQRVRQIRLDQIGM